jgi:hypothetical protein
MGITLQEDCMIEAKNAVEKLFCSSGNNFLIRLVYQHFAMIFVAVIVVAAIIAFFCIVHNKHKK